MNNNYGYMPTYTPTDTYMVNVLKNNKGKKVELFLSFPNAIDWKNKTLIGIIENTGNDFITLSDPSDGNWYLFPIYYIDFIKFEEQINAA